jgi:hypothetical protein
VSPWLAWAGAAVLLVVAWCIISAVGAVIMAVWRAGDDG